jgi:hypothetical protein
VSQIEDDPAVQWIPPGAVVDVERFRDECIDGFDPVIPQYLREFAFEGPRDAAAVAEGFRNQFAEAGWSKVIDTQTNANTGGPSGISLSFTKGFGDWSAWASPRPADGGYEAFG